MIAGSTLNVLRQMQDRLPICPPLSMGYPLFCGLELPMSNKVEMGLLLCSLLGGGEPDRATLKRLSNADWYELLQQSERHGVAPLLHWRLKNTDIETILPGDVKEGLREKYFQNFFRNMWLFKCLAEILTVLKDNNLPVIPLKGAHLAEIVYGNIALRTARDLDLLVRKDDLKRVAENLQELGYSPSKPFRLREICPTRHHLPRFTKPGGAPIEVHWTIIPPTCSFNIELDGLWSRARPAAIGGVQTLVLSPEDLLLLLCVHTSLQHRFNLGLRCLCDIGETLLRYRHEIDWHQVLVRARRGGTGKCVYLTLRLAAELLNVNVPGDVLNALEPNDLDTKHIIWARELVLAWQTNAPWRCRSLARVWKASGLQSKVANLLKGAFPSREVMAGMYLLSPSSMRFYLYYLVRLKQLVVRNVPIALRLLLRRKQYMMDALNKAHMGNALADWLTSPIRCRDE